LQAKYTDPYTKLRYASAEEYSTIKQLAPDIVTGYLTLRRENVIV
jgi:INO80 complex subunit C